MTVIDAIHSFLFHCEYEKNLSAETLRAYRIDITQFHAFVVSNNKSISLEELDRNVVREYIKHLHAQYKPKTIKRKIATIKAFYNQMIFEKAIMQNPFSTLNIRIKEQRRLPRAIDFNIIKSIFVHMYQSKFNMLSNRGANSYQYRILARDIAVLELLFTTGLRVSELSMLRKDQIDFLSKTINLVGKGGKERIVPFGQSDTVKALKEYERIYHNSISTFYFVNRFGNRLSSGAIRDLVKRRTADAGIKKNITPHMFRHSVATLLLEQGVDIYYIQELLGHSSLATTQIYIKLNTIKQRRAVMRNHPRKKITISDRMQRAPPDN